MIFAELSTWNGFLALALSSMVCNSADQFELKVDALEKLT
jgi:hypothetical protein